MNYSIKILSKYRNEEVTLRKTKTGGSWKSSESGKTPGHFTESVRITGNPRRLYQKQRMLVWFIDIKLHEVRLATSANEVNLQRK